jgi:kumamolisin
MVLIKQYAQREGAGQRLGFVAPILYEIASTKQPYKAFNDVVAGGNRYYRAGPGWDYVTGLGSPNVWNLARDMVRYLKSR